MCPLASAMDRGCHSSQGTSSAMASQVSLSGLGVPSGVLRAMYPGRHKRNVLDLSRMSAHYHVPNSAAVHLSKTLKKLLHYFMSLARQQTAMELLDIEQLSAVHFFVTFVKVSVACDHDGHILEQLEQTMVNAVTVGLPRPPTENCSRLTVERKVAQMLPSGRIVPLEQAT